MVSRLAPLGKMATVQFCPTQPEMPNYSLSLSISLISLSLTPILSLSHPLSFSFYLSSTSFSLSLSPSVYFYPTSLLSLPFSLSLILSFFLAPIPSNTQWKIMADLCHYLSGETLDVSYIFSHYKMFLEMYI